MCLHGKCGMQATVRCVFTWQMWGAGYRMCLHDKWVQATVRRCSHGKCGVQAPVRMYVHMVNVGCRPQ